ncbi:LysR family transcriptional regulator [Nocardia thailandica]|uniref:LysR family transcriptional regulator n=1 Tax=Nocardia thailandica TaxID=257275 RepID=A0ABW6PUJ0_9NOCA
MPTLRALECLVAVLDTGSVTEGAAALHMSQPALSHQLAALEREIGAPVVERLPRGVRATVVGRAIAEDARTALAAADRVVGRGRAVARGGGGELRLACAESLTATLLAPVLREHLRRVPLLRVSLTEAASADRLAELVDSGVADLAVGPRPTRWPGRSETVGAEEIRAVVPDRHPLADRADLSFADLADHPVVHYHRDNGLAGWLDAEAARHDVVLRPVVRTRQATTAARLAEAGLGVAIVPATALDPAFSSKPLRPRLFRNLVCLFGATGDPVVRDFADAVIGRGVPGGR